MKVRPSVKPMCDKCKIIKRNGKVRGAAGCPHSDSGRHPRVDIYC